MNGGVFEGGEVLDPALCGRRVGIAEMDAVGSLELVSHPCGHVSDFGDAACGHEVFECPACGCVWKVERGPFSRGVKVFQRGNLPGNVCEVLLLREESKPTYGVC
jgi:hypothetical protein